MAFIIDPVKPSDLYSNGYIVEFPEDGEGLLLREQYVIVGDEKDEYHLVKAGDKLRLIAYDRYKDYDSSAANLWWIIADANQILDPHDLSVWVGKELLIPDYQKLKLLKKAA